MNNGKEVREVTEEIANKPPTIDEAAPVQETTPAQGTAAAKPATAQPEQKKAARDEVRFTGGNVDLRGRKLKNRI